MKQEKKIEKKKNCLGLTSNFTKCIIFHEI